MHFETLPFIVFLILGAWSVWAWLCWINVLLYHRRYNRWKNLDLGQPVRNNKSPRVVIWAPVKDLGPHFDRHLLPLLRQNYPSYRIIFSMESDKDPGRLHLLRCLGHDQSDGSPVLDFDQMALLRAWKQISPGLEKIRIVIAGQTANQGQKIHNLIAAWQNDEGYGQIIAFTDADSLWELKTLQNLISPLKHGDVGLSTGYRWIVPEGNTLPSTLASVINGSISTVFGPLWRNNGWAGAMAIRRTLFEELDIPEFWQGKVNDDVSLTKQIKKKGLKIIFVPGVTPVNLVNYDWESFIAFSRRQYIQMWHYRFILWFYGALVTSSNVHGWIICFILILFGNAWGIVFAGIVYISDVLRSLARRQVAKNLLPKWATARMGKVFIFDLFLTPFWYFVHYCLVWSTAFARRLRWAGITYEIKDNTIRVISRNR